MKPKRMLVTEPLSLTDGRVIPRWSYVWCLAPQHNQTLTIEHRDCVYQVPVQQLIDTPVAPPSADQLRQLDECLANPGQGWQEVYTDQTHLFSVHRCAHGNYYLNDLRGGIAMYPRWVYLGPLSNPTPEQYLALWRHYHALPTDALFYLGVGCG